jgi:predicted PurR-regulated permease PerM
MDAERTLIILLSVTLIAVLIIVALVLMQIMKVVRSLQTITDKAHTVADNIVSASSVVKKAATPLMVSKVVGNIVDKMTDRFKSKRAGKKGSE